jgi:NAD(P)-dependent dehydrogenase (short-subunit alcohol dehydrogenase family)
MGQDPIPPETIVWITGATAGIGAALVRSLLYRDARVINLFRNEAAGVENLQVDLTDPEQSHLAGQQWARVPLEDAGLSPGNNHESR